MDNDKDRSALYEKPRRIIHNQLLIELLIVLAVAVPVPLAGFVFWAVFAVCPFVVVPAILVVWAVGVFGYVVVRLCWK